MPSEGAVRWPRRRTILRATAAVLLVAIGAAVVAVRSGWVHDQVRQLALGQLRRLINGEITFDRLTGSLVTGLSVHGLRIVQDGETVVAVEQLQASYDVLRLIRGSWIVDDVRLVRPRIVLRQTSRGWNLARLARASETPRSGTWLVDLSRVVIVDGHLRIEVPQRPAAILEQLEASASLKLSDTATEISLAHAGFHESTAGLDVNELRGRLDIAGTRLSVSGFHVRIPGLRADGGAAVSGGQIADANVTLTLADWSAARLAPHLPASAGRMPATTGTVTVAGRAPDFAVEWAIRAAAVGRSDGRIHLAWVADRPLAFTGRVSVAELDPAALLQRKDVEGWINANAEVDAALDLQQPDRTRLTLQVDASQSRLAGYRVDGLNARVEVNGSRAVAVGRVRAYDAQATFRATASGGVGDRPRVIDATGTITALDLAQLPPSLRAPAIESHVTADYTARYAETGWSVAATSRSTTISGVEIGPGSVARVAKNGVAMTAQVDAALPRVPATLVRLPADEVSDLQVRLNLDLSTDARRITSLAALSGSGTLSAVEYDSSRVNPTRADLDVAIADGIVQVRALDIRSPLVLATGSGSIAVAPDAVGESALDYRVDVPDLTRLSAFGVNGLSGGARVEGRLVGPSTEWRIDGAVAAHEVNYAARGSALALNGSIGARVRPGQWNATTGVLDLEGSFITVGGQEIPRLSLVASYADRRLGLRGRVEQARRSMDLTSVIDLHPDHQEVHLRSLTVAGSGAPWTFDGPDEATIRYSPAAVSVDGLQLRRGGEVISVGGRLALEAGADPASTLTVAMTDVDLGDVTTLAVGSARVDGTVTGTIEVGGMLAAPVARADVRLRDGMVVNVPVSSMTFEADVENRIATLRATVIETSGTTLEIAGRVPTSADAGTMDLRVQSTPISLGLVQAATSAVSDVTGTAVLDLHLTGTRAAPEVDGRVVVGGGGMVVGATGVAYQDVNADIRLADGWAIVEQARLTDDDGHTLEMSGRTATRASEGRRAVEMTIRGQDIRVLNNELGDVSLDLDLQVAGAVSAPRLTGDIVGSRVRLEVDALLRALGAEGGTLPPETDAPEPGSAAAAAPVASAPATGAAADGNGREVVDAPEVADAPTPGPATGAGPWVSSTIDVAIRLPENAVLRGRDLRVGSGTMGLGDVNMTVGGLLRLRKAPGATAGVVGAVEVVRGFYEFQGRRFTVGRGSALRFRGNELSNPVLDVTGEREVSGVTARVRVAGTAQRPVLSLSSSPALAESDVLALIVFNQPLSQLGASQQVDLLERAGDIALGTLASSLTESIGRALDVDLFEIRSPTAGEAGEVALGTQVNERVFIGVRQEFGSSEMSRVSIEYRISEALRLLTSVAQGTSRSSRTRAAETAGVDFVYTIKY